MNPPAPAPCECPGSDAVELVLNDAQLLWRILCYSPALGILDLCAAACVRRAWRDATRDDAEWKALLRRALPTAVALESDLVMHCGPGAYKRALMQLFRAGAVPRPLRFELCDYTLLMDAADCETGATVVRAIMPLSALETTEQYAWLRARVDPLPDGGAAAASFLARLAEDETDTRKLTLRLLLRRADGALAVLTAAQGAWRFEDLDDADAPLVDNSAELFNKALHLGSWGALKHPRRRRDVAQRPGTAVFRRQQAGAAARAVSL